MITWLPSVRDKPQPQFVLNLQYSDGVCLYVDIENRTVLPMLGGRIVGTPYREEVNDYVD